MQGGYKCLVLTRFGTMMVITPDRQCCIIRPYNGAVTMWSAPPCHTNVPLSHVTCDITWALVTIIMANACNNANVIL